MNLSLSPRYDLFRFMLPNEFLPKEVESKWQKYIDKDAVVVLKPLDYLNESIKGITIPGISDVNIQQNQHGSNTIVRQNASKYNLGRINVEPNADNVWVSSANPLDKISREFQVTFRLNQGMYNYFMMYETLFYRICKPELYDKGTDFFIDLLNEEGVAVSRIYLYDCKMDGIDGLEFSYDKVERQSDTFNVTFKFNNIDFDLVPQGAI